MGLAVNRMFILSIKDCLVPRKYDEDPKLATWVETQVSQMTSGQLEVSTTLTSCSVLSSDKARYVEPRLSSFGWKSKV